MDEFKRSDPNVISAQTSTYQERVVVERENNTALWWIVGILFAAVLLGLLFLLFRPAGPTDADLRVAQAEAAAEDARQTAEAALIQNQISRTRDVAIAQAQTATARADAIRATAEARAAEARAAAPVVNERQVEPTPPANGPAVITTTSPQPGN
ncbi:hypothetical protein ACLBV5_13230 [Brevundimonas sp. M1A4_2e]